MRHFRTFLLCGALAFTGARAETSSPGDESPAPAAYGDAELASYFASGPLKQAAAELQAGNAAHALKVIPARAQETPERWLRAQALRVAGHSRPARAAFEELANRDGPLADRALHLAALTAIEAGDAAVEQVIQRRFRRGDLLRGEQVFYREIAVPVVTRDVRFIQRCRAGKQFGRSGRGIQTAWIGCGDHSCAPPCETTRVRCRAG